jgi:hypothetical protein
VFAGVWNIQSYIDKKLVECVLPNPNVPMPIRIDLCGLLKLFLKFMQVPMPCSARYDCSWHMISGV